MIVLTKPVGYTQILALRENHTDKIPVATAIHSIAVVACTPAQNCCTND